MKTFLHRAFALMLSLQLAFASVSGTLAEEQEPLRVFDTTAGSPAMIMITGEPLSVVDVVITNPFQSAVQQKFQLNELGILQHWYDKAVVAGEYLVGYGDQLKAFQVKAGPASPSKSQLELSDYTAYTGEAIEGKLTAKDAYGNRIAGRELSLDVEGMATISCNNNCVTNAQGELFFAVKTNKDGLKTLTIAEAKSGERVAVEDLGFIPLVQQPQAALQAYAPYQVQPYQLVQPYGPYPFYASQGVANPYQLPAALPQFSDDFNRFDYLPISDPTQATPDAQGNDDRFLAQNLENFWSANLLDEDITAAPAAVAQAGGVESFEIYFGEDGKDPDREFEDSVTVAAQKALDIMVVAIDASGEVVEGFDQKVRFSISPEGPLVPNEQAFSKLDKGELLVELGAVLPVGQYVFRVEMVDDPTVFGELNTTAQFQGIPALNNTSVELKLDSPVNGGVYSNTVSFQGSVTPQENVTISILDEKGEELKKGPVDEQGRFSFPQDFDDGEQTVTVRMDYDVDGSTTETEVSFEVDKSAPVIIQVEGLDPEEVRAGEEFSMKVKAEANSVLKAFINNRVFEFEGEGENYSLTAKAPLDAGKYPVNLRIADKLGNSEDAQDVAELTVLESLGEIQNLFGIPGIGSVTLSWAALEGASSYEVSYKSILGSSEEVLQSPTARMNIKNLSANLSYVFTVTAKDASGADLSKPTQSRAIKVLEAPPRPSASIIETPVETVPEPQPNLKPAAEVQTKPVRHTSSGPEVYLLILASLILLNGYAKMRQALSRD